VCLRFESGLFIYFFPCNRAIGAFLISAFAMPQVGLDSLIAESDTSIIASLPAVSLLNTSIKA
jgi:hypothetical protein